MKEGKREELRVIEREGGKGRESQCGWRLLKISYFKSNSFSNYL